MVYSRGSVMEGRPPSSWSSGWASPSATGLSAPSMLVELGCCTVDCAVISRGEMWVGEGEGTAVASAMLVWLLKFPLRSGYISWDSRWERIRSLVHLSWPVSCDTDKEDQEQRVYLPYHYIIKEQSLTVAKQRATRSSHHRNSGGEWLTMLRCRGRQSFRNSHDAGILPCWFREKFPGNSQGGIVHRKRRKKTEYNGRRLQVDEGLFRQRSRPLYR